MKAIVLTYAPITKKEENLLQNTKIFKIACNWHAENLKPDLRLVLDDKETIKKALEVGKQKIISGNYPYPDKRVETVTYLPVRHSSLISCVDYLIINGYTDILLIANNQVTNGKNISDDFQKMNIDGINSVKDYAYIYKYNDNAVFDVPTKTIEEFLKMTENIENLVLGKEEPKKNVDRLIKPLAFSESYRYKVQTKGYDNESIENGALIANILPESIQQKILSGDKVVEYNGLVITRITGVKETKNNKKDSEKDGMSYDEMKDFVKKHNIKVENQKKETLIKAIEDYLNNDKDDEKDQTDSDLNNDKDDETKGE